MKVLFLGPNNSPLIAFLRADGTEVSQLELPISIIDTRHYDFLISYGYRFIIESEILSLFSNRAINLHISYLPWNRGADPNFWSFVDNTPKGVTIHHLDEGIDTGNIIVQKQIEFTPSENTLRKTYDRLQRELQRLFIENWDNIRNGKLPSKKQPPGGSFHRKADRLLYEYLLKDGWNTRTLLLGKHFNS